MSVRDSDMVNYTCQEDYEIKFQLQELSLLLYDICVWDHPLMTLRNFFHFLTPSPCHCPSHATYQYYPHVFGNPLPLPSVTSFMDGPSEHRTRIHLRKDWLIIGPPSETG